MVWKSSISQERRDGMVAAYLAGEKVDEISSRHGVTRATLYSALRAAGLSPGRATRAAPVTRAHHCAVCGARKRHPPSGQRSGEWLRQPTCGDPACVSLVMFVPHRRRSRPRGGEKRRSTELDFEEMLEYTEEADCGDIVEREFEKTVDERLADVPESMRSFPWNPAATVSIVVLSPAGKPGEVWMQLPAPAARSFVERYCGGDEGFLRGFDVIYAWRCGCPQQTVFVVERLADFPEEVGFYGACPRCGSVALAVEDA